jgi:hypothetical protein
VVCKTFRDNLEEILVFSYDIKYVKKNHLANIALINSAIKNIIAVKII